MTNCKITLVLRKISRYRDRLRDGQPGIVSWPVQENFLFSTASNGLWGPSSLLSNGLQRKSGRNVKLTTHLHQVPRSRKVELYLYSLILIPEVVFI
jgi:hypothetical protein